MTIQIRKAERRKAKLRMALIGPSGSGKTMSALKLAFGIGGKVGIIDTENGSADLYAHLGDYDVITLSAPYTVQSYREALHAFEAANYDVIIFDSISHAWAGEGGLLEKSSNLEKSGKVKNSYAAWREITPDHNRLVESLLQSPAHIIVTMRVKTEYVLEKDDRGKMVPRKIGLAPVQRDGVEYEFTLVMDISDNHIANASKDRTGLFDGWYDTISAATGRKLKEWLESGADAPPPPPPPPPRKTFSEFLEDLQMELDEAHDPEIVQGIKKREDVRRAYNAANADIQEEIKAMFVNKMNQFRNVSEEAA